MLSLTNKYVLLAKPEYEKGVPGNRFYNKEVKELYWMETASSKAGALGHIALFLLPSKFIDLTGFSVFVCCVAMGERECCACIFMYGFW